MRGHGRTHHPHPGLPFDALAMSKLKRTGKSAERPNKVRGENNCTLPERGELFAVPLPNILRAHCCHFAAAIVLCISQSAASSSGGKEKFIEEDSVIG